MEFDRTPSSQEESAALEQFRQKWREEVSARTKQSTRHEVENSSAKPQRRGSTSKVVRPINKPPDYHPITDALDEHSHDEDQTSRSNLIEKIEGLRVREIEEDDFSASSSSQEPQSALEHYERAVEKESQGNLGDSLSHYRKAYRLDAKVDQSYRKKHFPPKQKASLASTETDVQVTSNVVTNQPEQADAPLTFDEMVLSYGEKTIPNAKPLIEGDLEPPCPIKRLPNEVLLELLELVALRDPSVFVRLALVCKRFAYHVFYENSIWKRIALGSEFGLASQQYNFVTDVQGREAIFHTLQDDNEEDEKNYPPMDESLFPNNTNYRDVFHSHPRIRFSGVYISTVNYTRAGGVSATPSTWASSVHIVTYYRYLRFFRDGTLISLLTTNEPLEVVHHLTKENLAIVRPLSKNLPPGIAAASASKDGQTVSAAVQSFLKHALRGRWRLCHPMMNDTDHGANIGANAGVSGDLHIETEGAAQRYNYTMHLALKSGSRSKHVVKNNKLVWKGFWKYNAMTDDWAVFHLRNDKPFFYSRVRSYGLGY